jgi:hypothetical protein
MIPVDISFDFTSDANGRDPDSSSPTLRRYHQLLWSKSLPSGEIFNLEKGLNGSYLHYNSSAYKCSLSSDSIGHSYRGVPRMKNIIDRIDPDLVDSFWKLNCTIGGFIIFPSRKIDNSPTINGARGLNPKIADRFDLTLECIRRFYEGGSSPLEMTLKRNESFFKLFQSFKGYIDFFFLNDLVDPKFQKVHFFLEFDKLFGRSGFPSSTEEYLEYRKNSMAFTNLRNSRIADWATT